MAKKQQKPVHRIKLGMAVEATEGDLGEEDISKPMQLQGHLVGLLVSPKSSGKTKAST